MKIKKVFELFDDDEMKNIFEIPSLKGELGKNWTKLPKSDNVLLENILMNCPFILDFGVRSTKNRYNHLLEIGISSNYKIKSGRDIYVQFIMEITQLNLKSINNSKYNIKAYSKCVDNNHIEYSELIKFDNLSIIDMYSKINSNLYKEFSDLNDFINDKYGIKITDLPSGDYISNTRFN